MNLGLRTLWQKGSPHSSTPSVHTRAQSSPSDSPLRLALLVFLMVGWSSGSSAQSGPLISNIVSCPQCNIIFRSVSTLGDTIGPGLLLNRPTAVLRDRNQRFWVVLPSGPLQVYDHEGRFVATVGRLGGGPGEFDSPVGALLLPGDSVLVFDGGLGRATVIDPKLKVRRSIRLRWPLQPGVLLRWPASVILRGLVGSGASAKSSLHDVSFHQDEVEVQRSFGSAGTEWPSHQGSIAQFQTLAKARDGGLWSAPWFSYEVHKWTDRGEHVKSFHRRPSWFTEESRPWLGNHNTPPPPVVAAIQEDREGLLWVFLRIPAENWRLGWSRAPIGVKEFPARLIDVERLFDTMIEVIDPGGGAVLTRERLNGYLISVTDHRQLSIYAHGADGQPVIRIVDVMLMGRGL